MTIAIDGIAIIIVSAYTFCVIWLYHSIREYMDKRDTYLKGLSDKEYRNYREYQRSL